MIKFNKKAFNKICKKIDELVTTLVIAGIKVHVTYIIFGSEEEEL